MRTAAYTVETFGNETGMISSKSRKLLGQVDAVVFDCDGVLIDVRQSYDSAILRTAAIMVEGFTGVRFPLETDGEDLILGIRRTGGFNDDWDTTYALAMFSTVAIAQLQKDGEPSVDGFGGALEQLRRIVDDFSSKNRLEGRTSVDEYLETNGLESSRIKGLREYLNHPVDSAHGRMTRTFDEMYYGATLFERVFGLKATWSEEGLIERENVMVSRETLDRLKKLLGAGKLAIATGRPFVAVQYTLGEFLGYFDQEASVYIGDGDVDPNLAPGLRKYKKPSGESLLRAYEKLASKTLLYVGDSAEDRLMVDDARKTCRAILFGGIYGTSFSEDRQIAFFTRRDSDFVTRTIESLPVILEKMRA